MILKPYHICLAAHEFETHPYFQQPDLVKWHRDQGIQVIADSLFQNADRTGECVLPGPGGRKERCDSAADADVENVKGDGDNPKEHAEGKRVVENLGASNGR
jgi:diketogulonate reductase-like aldo/keto reductase